MNGADLLHLRLKNNLHGMVKKLVNDPLLFNHIHLVNQLLKYLMFLVRLGGNNKPSMDQVMYYVYKTDDNMEEHAPKLNNTEIFPLGGHQVPEFTKDDEVDQNTLNQGVEDEYYISDEESYGDDGDKESEFDGGYVVPKTQYHVIDPRYNGGCVLRIWSHRRLKFVNAVTITAYYLSPLQFVYTYTSSNVEYSHNLACGRQILRIFGQGKS